MKKTIGMALFMMFGLLVAGTMAEAAAGWETNLLISAGAAENRLSFGQMADATNQADGRYDVPAVLTGTLQAAFTDGGGTLWRDIRAFGRDREEWRLVIAGSADQPLKISWDAEGLPKGFSFELLDTGGGQLIAMETLSTYTLAKPTAVLTVRVSAKRHEGVK